MLALSTAITVPPSDGFTINRASPQARGLTHWWPLAKDIRDHASNFGTPIRQGNAMLGATSMGLGAVLPGASGDRINVGNPPSAQGASYLTVAIWANTNTLTGGDFNLRYLIANEAINSGWMLRLATADKLLYWYVYSGGYRNATSTFQLEVNRWYHFACVYNAKEVAASQLKLYIDGRLNAVGTSGGAAIANSGQNIGIGESPEYAGRTWSGWARDARIYNRALSDPEIYQLWAPATRYDLFSIPRLQTVGMSGIPGIDTTVHLTWTDNSEGEDGFSIERADDGGGFVEIDTVVAGAETYDDTVDVGHTYTYRVRATSAALGDSEYSNEAKVIV